MKCPGISGMTICCMVILVFCQQVCVAAPDPAYQYSIGSPTDEEQLFVELINRARSDAGAEALRQANTTDPVILAAIDQFGVNLFEMLNQFALLEQQVPPVSINTHLQDMARLHTQDMFDNAFQGHVSSSNPPPPFSPGDELQQRVDNFPLFDPSFVGENVFAWGRSVDYAHAAFQIEWSRDGEHGMQVPPGHRENIHNSIFKEIGVGVILGTNTVLDQTVGPLLVTQNFGTQNASPAFVTGVAYFDLNNNQFYDIGEGLGGISVESSAGQDWATTADSGGYSIPIFSNGTYSVNFSAVNLASDPSVAGISNGNNIKVDLRLSYQPPNVIGTLYPITGQANEYVVSPVPAATGYCIRVLNEDASIWNEGAENGTTEVSISQSTAYQSIQSDRVQTGTYAFHLAHGTINSEEIIQLNKKILPTSSSSLIFSSRLQYATDAQIALVEASTDDGHSWEIIFTQAGGDYTPETLFNQKSVPLSQFSGAPILIRFRYMISGSSYYNQTTNDVGWLIDDISVSNSTRLTILSETQSPTHDYSFTPATDGAFIIMACALNYSRQFPFGPFTRLHAGSQSAIEIWRSTHFSPSVLNEPANEATIWGDDADPDFDGISNFIEFALGGNPNLPDASSFLPQLSRTAGQLKLQYTKQSNDVRFRVLANSSLSEGTWSQDGVSQLPNPDFSPVGTLIEASADFLDSRKFLRLEAIPNN